MHGKYILGVSILRWFSGVIGVIFLGVMFDLIYPSGKTNGFCKSIFGIVSVVMILTPIFNIKIDNFVDDFVDYEIIESINDVRVENLRVQIIKHLNSKEINGVDVEIFLNVRNNGFDIENVYVDTTNLVLTENITNINKYEVISNEVFNITKIDKDRIIVYG